MCMRQRGRDALVNAPTGSGKTLAYLAAIVNDLQAQEPRVSRAEGTHALIVVPTRELCLQIADVLTLILRRYIWLVRTNAAVPVSALWLALHGLTYSIYRTFTPIRAAPVSALLAALAWPIRAASVLLFTWLSLGVNCWKGKPPA